MFTLCYLIFEKEINVFGGLFAEGKQIDPKLIRVVPVIKKAMHALPKPPTPTNSKRIIGCSWSAFKRKNIVKRSQRKIDLLEI